MAKTTRLFKSFFKLLFPIVLLIVLAIGAASIWLVHQIARPPRAEYLVTPEKYGQLSSRGSQVTHETWTNRDGTPARGWLLRGAENSPAVLLLHRFGADRSHLLNLGVKLNEATDFSVLMPDQRSHGQDPSVENASLGGCEANDAGSAIEFLRAQKSPGQVPLVGKEIGVYGLEMGALVAMSAASRDETITALVLDSVPLNSDHLIAALIAKRFPFGSSVTSRLGQLGAYPYFYDGCYERVPVCELAKTLGNRKLMLLAGLDAPDFQDSTSKLSKCFPASTRTETKTDLSPSGHSIINASIELSEAYDQRVIDFFRKALASQEGEMR